MAADDTTRITVSRDALRADLAEMELRLRLYFDERLAAKADQTAVLVNTTHLTDLRRGEFTDAFRRAIVDIVEHESAIVQDRGWTKRERLIGVLAMVLAIASFAFTVYVTTSAPNTPLTPSSPPADTTEGP